MQIIKVSDFFVYLQKRNVMILFYKILICLFVTFIATIFAIQSYNNFRSGKLYVETAKKRNFNPKIGYELIEIGMIFLVASCATIALGLHFFYIL